MTEVLSPAGNVESLKSAIENGANAIYMGAGNFNARAMANNFTIEEYIDCIEYAHLRNVKVYLTLNTLIKDSEIKDAMEMLIKLYKYGLDAVIVQDIGIAMLIKEIMPKLELHASTQMSIHNLRQVKFIEKLGFKRVVLAREMTFDEIKYIRENTKLEIEIFVHGALCVSYSGQCLMSSMIGSRSGNRGKCAGTCRMKYSLLEDSKTIESDKHLISKKDIFGIEYVKKLIDIGIDSLKLEGRSKSKEYVGIVTAKYRKAVDSYYDSNINVTELDKKELLQMFNRGEKHVGYLKDVPSRDSITYTMAKNVGVKIGEVTESNSITKNNMVKICLYDNESISMHDGIEIHTKSGQIISFIVTCIKETNGKILNDIVSSKTCLIGDVKQRVGIGDEIYKTSSSMLNEKYDKISLKVARKQDIYIEICIKQGKKIYAMIGDEKIDIEYVTQKAKTKGVRKEQIYEAMSKTGDMPFNLNVTKLEIDELSFVPVSELNNLRRKIVEFLINKNKINRDVTKIEEKLQYILSIDIFANNYTDNVKDSKMKMENEEVENIRDKEKTKNKLIKDSYCLPNWMKYSMHSKINGVDSLYIYKYNKENEEVYLNSKYEKIYINIEDIYKDESILENIGTSKKIYICIPNIVLNNLDKYIQNSIENVIAKYNIKGVLIGNIGYIDMLNSIKEKYNLRLVAEYSLNVFNMYSALVYIHYGIDVITVSTELLDEEIIKLKRYFSLETVTGAVTAMTTRFCPIKAYSKCGNCTLHKYILKDSHNLKYDVISSNIDCISKLIREKENKIKDVSIRKCIIE